ncbi:FtsX-like permease family protein [Actinoplanes sp. NPDC051851]|uniref:FtsX-like permease family protein n=1 Tax=Actinoplanes sp. NPDC051851 TaxID=3154753 RepID=UPI00341D0189
MRGVHWGSVRGRARADAGALGLIGVVVGLISLVAGMVPVLLRETADDAVRQAIREGGSDATVRALAHWEPDWGVDGGRDRAPELAQDVADFRDRAGLQLGDELRSVLRAPIATAASPTLKVTDGSVLRTFQLDYLAGATGPAVTWVQGEAPGGNPGRSVDGRTPWTVQVGLVREAADALGVRPGDRLQVADENGGTKDVRVSGIFAPADAEDPAWRLAPWLLGPVAGADGIGTTRFGGLLSDDSLPDARLAFDPDDLVRTVWFAPEPSRMTWDSAQRLADLAVRLKATSAASGVRDSTSRWETQLDAVLLRADDQVNAATALASVLLSAVMLAGALILLLAADLLARRRTADLTVARQRGVSLPAIAAELLIESGLLTLAAVGLARLVSGGFAWRWVLPVAVVAIAAGPVFGVVAAARATRNRRVPANRAARAWAARTTALRRLAAELGVLAAAALAATLLYQRGVANGTQGGTAGGAPGGVAGGTIAPALGALAGALLLLRLLPPVTGLLLRWALRSRRPLAVFGAAQASATSRRALPLVAVVVAVALASFAATLRVTTTAGLADGARQYVGADYRLDVENAAIEQVAGRPGVEEAAVGQVVDGAVVLAGDARIQVRLAVVDVASYRRIWPEVPDLKQSAALVLSSDGSMRPGMRITIPQEGGKPAVVLTATGTAPPVDGATDVVLVDRSSMPEFAPNTIWVDGTLDDGLAASAVLRDRRSAPLVEGLLRLAWGAALALLLLALLGLALGTAATAPGRWQVLGRLRTLGVRTREMRLISAGESLPGVLMAAIGGPLIGIGLASVMLGPLGLRRVTAQVADPAPVLPWLPLTGFALTIILLSLVSTALDGRRRSMFS